MSLPYAWDLMYETGRPCPGPVMVGGKRGAQARLTGMLPAWRGCAGGRVQQGAPAHAGCDDVAGVPCGNKCVALQVSLDGARSDGPFGVSTACNGFWGK